MARENLGTCLAVPWAFAVVLVPTGPVVLCQLAPRQVVQRHKTVGRLKSVLVQRRQGHRVRFVFPLGLHQVVELGLWTLPWGRLPVVLVACCHSHLARVLMLQVLVEVSCSQPVLLRVQAVL